MIQCHKMFWFIISWNGDLSNECCVIMSLLRRMLCLGEGCGVRHEDMIQKMIAVSREVKDEEAGIDDTWQLAGVVLLRDTLF